MIMIIAECKSLVFKIVIELSHASTIECMQSEETAELGRRQRSNTMRPG